MTDVEDKIKEDLPISSEVGDGVSNKDTYMFNYSGLTFSEIFKNNFSAIPNKWAYDYMCRLESLDTIPKQTPEMFLVLMSLLVPPIYNRQDFFKNEDTFFRYEYVNYGWIVDKEVHIHFSENLNSIGFWNFICKFSDIVNYNCRCINDIYIFKENEGDKNGQ